MSDFSALIIMPTYNNNYISFTKSLFIVLLRNQTLSNIYNFFNQVNLMKVIILYMSFTFILSHVSNIFKTKMN